MPTGDQSRRLTRVGPAEPAEFRRAPGKANAPPSQSGGHRAAGEGDERVEEPGTMPTVRRCGYLVRADADPPNMVSM